MYFLIFTAKVLDPNLNEDRAFGWVFIPGMALAITLGQMLVLSQFIRRPWGWLAANGLGWAVCLAGLAWVVPRVSAVDVTNLMPVFSLAVGTVLGLAQWLYLRRYFYRAGWWPVSSVLGWAMMGLVVGATFTSIFEVGLFGLAPAVFTGAALAWMAGRPREQRQR